MKEAMDSIEAALNMKGSGKAGVPKTDELRAVLAGQKSKWLGELDSDAFYFYHAVRSTEMILDKMDDRFKNAASEDDIANTAKDALAVVRPMRDLLDALDANHISEETIDTVLERTDGLLTAAANADLRESIETSRAMIDEDLLKSKYSKLKRNILRYA